MLIAWGSGLSDASSMVDAAVDAVASSDLVCLQLLVTIVLSSSSLKSTIQLLQ
jgi:diphthamide biosynthesis methyltransferase